MFAIAGTDIRSLAHRKADARLGRFLESSLPQTTPDRLKERFKVVCSRWQSATRLHADGRNVLVDFEKTETTRFGPAHQAVLGHGIYTLPVWLPRQLELVMEWMERDGPGQA